MNNTELDLALASLIPTMVTLPATCTLDISNLTNTLPTALTSRGNTTILLPMWFRHHWVLGALHGDTLDVWDSAPSPLVKEDILRFAATLALRLGTTLRVRGRATSRQPWGTRQCGTHAIVRAVLLSLNLNFALPTDQVVDFELLRRVLPTPSRNTAPIAALLASVAHPNYIDAATNNTRIPPLQAASIRAQPSWRPAYLCVVCTLSIARLCNTKGRGLYRYPNFRLSSQHGPRGTYSQRHVNRST